MSTIRMSGTHHIKCLGRNENGRSPSATYVIHNGEATVFHGEVLDSPEDEKMMEDLSRRMEETRREYLIKEAGSWRDAAKVVINC